MRDRTPRVIYEDNHLLVLAKPPGMPTVPDITRDLSLLDWGKAYLKQTRSKPGNVFLGVVHRLDRPVSGVVCLAVTSKAAARLSGQMREKRVKKTYVAVVEGSPPGGSLTLTHLLWKDRRRNRVRLFPPDDPGGKGRPAVSRLRYLAGSGGHALLELTPITGRPHQLRAQCASMGTPILGDLKYGAREALDGGSIALHATALEIAHPTRAERMVFKSAPFDERPWNLFQAGESLPLCDSYRVQGHESRKS